MFAMALLRRVGGVVRVSPRLPLVPDARGLSHLKGPGLEYFLANPKKEEWAVRTNSALKVTPDHPYLSAQVVSGRGRKVYMDVHGCQMNVSDSEVVRSILLDHEYTFTSDRSEADVWLIVTCSIRENAEAKIFRKLNNIRNNSDKLKPQLKLGLLGCMAERLRSQLLTLVDVVAGPDSYRDLPRLLAVNQLSHEASINVMLSLDETYADVRPVRMDDSQINAFVSIQRGCDNMCSYCIVPFTRGRERGRAVQSILDEVRFLVEEKNVKEITLLGQNVNSYRDVSENSLLQHGHHLGLRRDEQTRHSKGDFNTIYKAKEGGLRFADLLHLVSEINDDVRIRFTSPHPKDFPDDLLQLIKERENVCKSVHLPAQSGNTRILELMRRGYSREAYLELVEHMKNEVKDITFSSDFIVGFCSETETEFEDTLSLVEQVGFTKFFTFAYSLREKTHAHRKLVDDVSAEVKNRRLVTLHETCRRVATKINQKYLDTQQVVLIEGESKRSSDAWHGRAESNLSVIFPKNDSHLKPGHYCLVHIDHAGAQTLWGSIASRCNLRGQPIVSEHESSVKIISTA